MTRVAVIDRAAPVRSLLSKVIARADGLQIGHCAADVEKGLELLGSRSDDVAILGLHPVPAAEAADILKAITQTAVPLIVLTSPLGGLEWRMADAGPAGEQASKVVVLPKPDRPEGWERLQSELPDLIRDLGRTAGGTTIGSSVQELTRSKVTRVLALGASAGGPAAVCETLRAVGQPLQHVAVVVVQHIDPGFVSGFVDWLGRELRCSQVALARHGEHLRPGRVRVAPANAQLLVADNGCLRLDGRAPARNGHCPSVDAVFDSLAKWCPSEVAAVVLSGMGQDGAEGLLGLRRAGALTIAQDAVSSAVFGMPGAAIERGAAMVVLPPSAIGTILSTCILGRST